MSGEVNLHRLLSGLTAELQAEVYVFVTLPEETALPADLKPRMLFREGEGLTLIVPQQEAEKRDWPNAFPCRMITLTVHSSLEAVGFIAHIATALAERGLGVNPVSAFFHDHLFIPLGREADALAALADLAAKAKQSD